MKQKHEFKSIVAETLLIPLYMRAKESRRERPILNDKAAECLADTCPSGGRERGLWAGYPLPAHRWRESRFLRYGLTGSHRVAP